MENEKKKNENDERNANEMPTSSNYAEEQFNSLWTKLERWHVSGEK